MLHISHIPFTPFHEILPTDLCGTTVAMPLVHDVPAVIVKGIATPLNEGYFVPLGVFDTPLEFVEPTIARIGNGAVRLSLGRPFGVMEGIGGCASANVTQKIDEIDFSVSSDPVDGWCGTLRTDSPVNEQDLRLFKGFFSRYVMKAGIKITARG